MLPTILFSFGLGGARVVAGALDLVSSFTVGTGFALSGELPWRRQPSSFAALFFFSSLEVLLTLLFLRSELTRMRGHSWQENDQDLTLTVNTTTVIKVFLLRAGMFSPCDQPALHARSVENAEP